MGARLSLTYIVTYGHLIAQHKSPALPPSATDPLRALQSALNDHDARRRSAFAGVMAAELEADKQLWRDIGEAIAALARRIADGCAASAFVAGRPAVAALRERLVESIDDQLEPAAWTVVDAAARAALRR